jgi:hypothetical protein
VNPMAADTSAAVGQSFGRDPPAPDPPELPAAGADADAGAALGEGDPDDSAPPLDGALLAWLTAVDGEAGAGCALVASAWVWVATTAVGEAVVVDAWAPLLQPVALIASTARPAAEAMVVRRMTAPKGSLEIVSPDVASKLGARNVSVTRSSQREAAHSHAALTHVPSCQFANAESLGPVACWMPFRCRTALIATLAGVAAASADGDTISNTGATIARVSA